MRVNPQRDRGILVSGDPGEQKDVRTLGDELTDSEVPQVVNDGADDSVDDSSGYGYTVRG